tara:strand:+ start:461 stop:847 length:387 start_codon:yes stop_codon:yes gene_type:complete
MEKLLGNKTLIEFDERDPIRNLWRNVLVVAIEDAIKVKTAFIKFSEFYNGKKSYELDYVTKDNRDFNKVCELAQLDGNVVRKKINKVMKEMEENHGKSTMPKMPWKRLYQSEGVNRQSNGDNQPMSIM